MEKRVKATRSTSIQSLNPGRLQRRVSQIIPPSKFWRDDDSPLEELTKAFLGGDTDGEEIENPTEASHETRPGSRASYRHTYNLPSDIRIKTRENYSRPLPPSILRTRYLLNISHVFLLDTEGVEQAVVNQKARSQPLAQCLASHLRILLVFMRLSAHIDLPLSVQKRAQQSIGLDMAGKRVQSFKRTKLHNSFKKVRQSRCQVVTAIFLS
jgi:hypothetical protein